MVSPAGRPAYRCPGLGLAGYSVGGGCSIAARTGRTNKENCHLSFRHRVREGYESNVKIMAWRDIRAFGISVMDRGSTTRPGAESLRFVMATHRTLEPPWQSASQTEGRPQTRRAVGEAWLRSVQCQAKQWAPVFQKISV